MFDINLTRFGLFVVSLSCGALWGCANQPSQTDLQFGLASKGAFLAQQSTPVVSQETKLPHVSDGVVMKSAIDRYQKSFETLPVPINIFNIGVGTPMTASPQR